MDEHSYYIIIILFLFCAETTYFAIARRYNIVDTPNQRSSHTYLTIRGGGIIFPIALLLQTVYSGLEYSQFALGLMVISLISFYDDLRPLSSKLRLLGHLIAVSFLFIQSGIFGYPWWVIVAGYVIVIGTINAYNFMDGINGITSYYGLVFLLSLYVVNEFSVYFMSSQWLIICSLSLLVFSFFNFRRRAVCFAGDIGSISIAYTLIFFLLLLIIESGDISYVCFFLVYGLDAITTISFRLVRGENIFLAHRTHFYQFLANSKSWPHITVAFLYGSVQLIINILLIMYSPSLAFVISFIFLAGLAFVMLRINLEGVNNLLTGVNGVKSDFVAKK